MGICKKILATGATATVLLTMALALTLGLSPGAWAQTAALLPNGQQQFVDANGQPYASGTVYFYVPATTTPKNTWQDANQSTLNTNPITLDSAGRGTIYGSGQYRQVLMDSLGNTVWDKLTSAISISSGSLGQLGVYTSAGTQLGPLASGTVGNLLSSSGPGAVPVWVSSASVSCTAGKANCVGWYNVVSYGADPTGVSDSLAAVTGAISAASAGGVIYFPTGTYKLSASVIMPSGAKLDFVGDGVGNTILYEVGSSANGITVANTGLNNFAGGIRDLTLTTDVTYSCSNSTGSSGNGIDVSFAGDNWHIDNVLLYGFTNNLRYRDSWNTTNTNIESLCYKNTGILLDYQTGSSPSGTGSFDNIFVGTRATGAVNTAGIFIGADGGTLWSNVNEGGAGNGIVFRPKVQTGGEPGIGAQYFSNVYMDTNTSAGWLYDTATNTGSSIYSVSCSNCWGSFNSDVGVNFSTGGVNSILNVEYSGGRFTQNAFQGIFIGSGVSGITFGQAYIADNSFPGTGGTSLASPGVEIAANALHVNLNNNHIGNSGTSGTTQGTGITLDTGPSNYINVQGNDLSTYGGTSSLTNGSSGGVNIICNNVGTVVVVNCSGGGGGISGTINTGNIGQLATYASTGTTLSGTSTPVVNTLGLLGSGGLALGITNNNAIACVTGCGGSGNMAYEDTSGQLWLGNPISGGNVVFQNHLSPSVTDTYNLGQSGSIEFNSAFVKNLVASTGATVAGNPVNSTSGSITSGHCPRYSGSAGLMVDGGTCVTGVSGSGNITASGSTSVTVGMTSTPSFTTVNAGQYNNAAGQNLINGSGGNVFLGNGGNVASVGNFLPNNDNTYSNGNTSFRWTALWAVNGTIQTSDLRDKHVEGYEELGMGFVSCLNPIVFRWKENEDKGLHHGFGAQELDECLDGREFAGLYKPKGPNDRYALTYTDLIAPLWRDVQELNALVQVLFGLVIGLVGWNLVLSWRIRKLGAK